MRGGLCAPTNRSAGWSRHASSRSDALELPGASCAGTTRGPRLRACAHAPRRKRASRTGRREWAAHAERGRDAAPCANDASTGSRCASSASRRTHGAPEARDAGKGEWGRKVSSRTEVRARRRCDPDKRTWSRSFLALPFHAFQVCLRRGSSSGPATVSSSVGCVVESDRGRIRESRERRGKCDAGQRGAATVVAQTQRAAAGCSSWLDPAEGAPPPLGSVDALPGESGGAQPGRKGAANASVGRAGSRRASSATPRLRSEGEGRCQGELGEGKHGLTSSRTTKGLIRGRPVYLLSSVSGLAGGLGRRAERARSEVRRGLSRAEQLEGNGRGRSGGQWRFVCG